jgi:hypothetical protein
MKKFVLSFMLISMSVLLVTAQRTINDPLAEKRNVGSFHGIEVATGIKLVLTTGNTEAVVVSASKTEYRERIITEVRNGVLKIYYDYPSDPFQKKGEGKNLKAYVSYKSINRLEANTGAEVTIEGKLEANTLDLNANTGALVNGELNVGELKVKQNTGSKITVSGKVNNLEAEGDTGSKFMGENLLVNTCDVNVSTGAGVTVSVEKEMNVKATTGGYLKYKGNAGIREIKTNTGGYVSRI